MSLFSHTIKMLEQGLDYAALREKVIANNIANADTPNYKAKDVQFKAELVRAMHSLEAKRTNPKHLPFSHSMNEKFVVATKGNLVYNHNGNDVDIDREMSNLAENQIYYNALIERLSGNLTTLKTVIRGGK
ncbi:flagellar basal body rod protein FlgB [Parageobacillus sp. VR-IP]|uniref:flagellar basal body rod protein FlgB n=1 Tax=Parageobacillus sp. VR-IP TaxID=2742205 RepID=UPI001583F031|nr:flagellar basal body rod protein FlgB [Parageobacillus sp. VR-IP]NUK29111.1 flagellar basal body rod protein FlgB [Parageobacillus sp. VR-IP]